MTGLVVVVAAYLGLCLFLFVAQRSFLYAPDRTRPDPVLSGVPEMTVRELVAADGTKLLAWYSPAADDTRPLIVYFHGNAGHIGGRGMKMKPLMEAGFGLLLLSYRGYGGNPGRPDEMGLYADARAAMDYARDQGVGGERLVIYGESLGSGVAVQMASERAIAALILEAPFTSLTQVAFEKVPYAPIPLLIRDRFDSIKKIGAIKTPLLLVHGEKDRTVRVAHGRKLFAAANEPKQALFLTDAGHGDLYDFGVAAQVADFISRAMAASRRSGAAALPHEAGA